MSSDKQRWPWKEALAVADEIIAALAGACTRIKIAGSLRRNKPDVGDVEILFVPRFEDRQVDMFTVAPWNLAEWEIGCLIGRGLLSKRPNKHGGFAYGPKNKLLLHRSGVPVDLFTASDANWFNYLVCRTGGAESNVAVASAAQRKGWQWNPYGPGFSRIGQVHLVACEREVFDFVGLPFLAPEDRR